MSHCRSESLILHYPILSQYGPKVFSDHVVDMAMTA